MLTNLIIEHVLEKSCTRGTGLRKEGIITMNAKESIVNGKAALGIEFGSTRIKAVLVDENCKALAVGSYQWENQLVDGVWTYSLEAIHTGLQAGY